MGRHSCCYKQKLRKGLWSPEEDEKLLRHITKYGHGCWSSVPKQAGLQRCGKSCRLRWINYLRPDLKRGTFSEDEENLIVELHKVLGNRWSQIAAQLPGRTDNEIKNLWNSCLKKKLRQRGIDPVTHKPLSEVENGEANVTTTNSIEMVSGISNELNLLQVDNSNSNSNSNSKSSTTILERRPSLVSSRGYDYPPEVEGNSGSKMEKSNNNINNGNRVTPTSNNKDFFLDRFVNSHNESSTTTTSSHPSDFMGYFPLQQLNYASSNRTSVNPNSTLWFTQPGSKTYDMNSEFSSINNNTISAVLPPMNSLKSSSTAFHSQSPSMSSSFDINGCRYWEVGASSNSSSSSGSNSSAELHNNNNNNNNAFENSLFSWGLADCSTSDKDSQIHLMETVQEDIKWPEILRNPFLMAAATFQNQTPQPLYNEIKSETQFDSRNIGAMWPHHNQQQQEPLQTSDICTAAFGHI